MKILLATDGSTFSAAATEKALAFDFPPGSELKVISVVNFPIAVPFDPIVGMPGNYAEMQEIARRQAEEAINRAVEKFKEAKGDSFLITTEILTGTAESAIVETAEKWGADLIIVGSHGYNTWERLLLGSVSNSVVHHAPCSVLVVREPKNKR